MDPQTLAPRDLRRLVAEMWLDERCDGIAADVLDAAIARDAKSLDRAVLIAYLRHFPTEHPAFGRLRAASSFAAGRRDWPWRERGERWALWDEAAGPATLAQTLLDADDPAAAMRGAGLDGDLAHGEFVAEAIEAACERAAHTCGEEAQRLGERLISLFERMEIADRNAELVRGLLLPWVRTAPDKAYRDRMGKLLTARIGDPRFAAAKWQALLGGGTEATDMIAVLRRWLTDRTVRQFFAIVGRTTNDPQQWAARESFWLAYLDDGVIDEAWFAFGRQAEDLAGHAVKQDGLQYGQIIGSGADPSHSALIMSIGDIRIAEWSHNGSCRFWSHQDRKAPTLYQKQYFGMTFRAMNGGEGFEGQFAAIPHASGWQGKFAGFIRHFSGQTHPRHGDGLSWGGGFRSSATYKPTGKPGWG